MLKWASLLGILCTTCAFTGGCATTAGDIASGYHTLGTGWFSKAEEKRLVAMIGVEDLIVVDTPDALMICKRQDAQKVRQFVEMLRERGETDYL